MWKYIHKYASPKIFYDLSLIISKWCGIACLIFLVTGLYGGLVWAPADYQQGDSFRIIYIHVPSAWMSLFIYMVMAISGGMGLIWHTKIAEIIARSSAPIGGISDRSHLGQTHGGYLLGLGCTTHFGTHPVIFVPGFYRFAISF